MSARKFSKISKSEFRPPSAHAVYMSTEMHTQSQRGRQARRRPIIWNPRAAEYVPGILFAIWKAQLSVRPTHMRYSAYQAQCNYDSAKFTKASKTVVACKHQCTGGDSIRVVPVLVGKGPRS